MSKIGIKEPTERMNCNVAVEKKPDPLLKPVNVVATSPNAAYISDSVPAPDIFPEHRVTKRTNDGRMRMSEIPILKLDNPPMASSGVKAA
jgi:hypothetical protein